MNPRGWTLHTQLLAGMIVLYSIVMLGAGVFTVLQTRSHLTQQLETELARAVDRGDSVIAGPGTMQGSTSGMSSGGTVVLRLALRDGMVVNDSRGDPINRVVDRHNNRTSLSPSDIATLERADLDGTPREVDLSEHIGEFLLVATPFDTGAVLITGVPIDPLEDTLQELVNIVTIGTILGLLVVGVGGSHLIRRNLHPLEQVAATARQVSGLQLDTGDVTLPARVRIQDVTAHNEVGQVGLALNSLLDHVESALQVRQESETRVRQFVADASHELRTPLASIRGYAELAHREHEPVPATITYALGRIESEALRMSSLVDDLLLLARLDEGRPLAYEEVDVSRLAIDAVSDARAASPGHRWEVVLPAQPVTIMGDPARLHQVVANLLANARIHTPEGTRVVTRLEQAGDTVRLSVTDDGPGIPKGLQATVLERFTRGDDARNRARGSTGLGLSIVAAVTQAHGGQVQVESAPGRTRVTIILPAYRATLPAARDGRYPDGATGGVA